MDGVREWTEQSIDVSVKVALAEGTTIRHARELLNGDADRPWRKSARSRDMPDGR